MKPPRRAVFLISSVGLAAIFLLVVGCSPSPREISVLPAGTTNGIVGITNGSWAVYCVTNHTTNSFLYAGTRIELRKDNGWIEDPALTPTEIGGWLAPATRVWHDGTGALTGGGSFHIFFNTSERGVPWRASLRFLPNRASVVPALLRTNPATSAAVAEAALSVLDRSRPYDCPVPEVFK